MLKYCVGVISQTIPLMVNRYFPGNFWWNKKTNHALRNCKFYCSLCLQFLWLWEEGTPLLHRVAEKYFLSLEMLIPIYIDELILLHNIYWIKWCFHIKLQHALQYLCPLVSVFTLDSCQQINFSISSTWPRATVDISSNL